MKINRIVPIVSTVSGIGLLSSVNKDKLTGRETLYHGTNRTAKESILKEGLKGEYALDPNNLTNSVLKNIGIKDGRKLVYLTKDKDISNTMKEVNLLKDKIPDSIKIKIPYKEYKNLKRVYNNPEFKGAKDFKDWVKKINFGKEEKGMREYWDDFSGAKGTSGTEIYENDIDPKYIKDSKKYQPQTIKEFKDYVKDNPYRFGKELGKLSAGLLLSGMGIKKLVKR